MKSIYLAPLAALLLISPVYADHGEKHEPAKSRQEAIERTKERLAKLEKMTDQEWAAKRDERKKRWEERKQKRAERHQGHEKTDAPKAAEPAKN